MPGKTDFGRVRDCRILLNGSRKSVPKLIVTCRMTGRNIRCIWRKNDDITVTCQLTQQCFVKLITDSAKSMGEENDRNFLLRRSIARNKNRNRRGRVGIRIDNCLARYGKPSECTVFARYG